MNLNVFHKVLYFGVKYWSILQENRFKYITSCKEGLSVKLYLAVTNIFTQWKDLIEF